MFILLLSFIIFGYLSFELNVWNKLFGMESSQQIVIVQCIYILFLIALTFIIEQNRSHHPSLPSEEAEKQQQVDEQIKKLFKVSRFVTYKDPEMQALKQERLLYIQGKGQFSPMSSKKLNKSMQSVQGDNEIAPTL